MRQPMFRVQKVALQTLELSESLNWCIQVPTHCIISLADLVLLSLLLHHLFPLQCPEERLLPSSVAGEKKVQEKTSDGGDMR